ncbi:hypothetical protein E2C01_091781 [Portunus trituberculatus]|uniref:Uncharacterized protein n=1 Tax=Portunus trituberculatus TaxID=210409 RepID=A0A5B7JTV6_PORTR|nr:hypothetical protein [Portunus trituberculatus]
MIGAMPGAYRTDVSGRRCHLRAELQVFLLSAEDSHPAAPHAPQLLQVSQRIHPRCTGLIRVKVQWKQKKGFVHFIIYMLGWKK